MAIVSEQEPNDFSFTANPINLGDTVNGSLSSVVDWDYFKVLVASPGVLKVDFSAPTSSSNFYFDVTVYDASLNILAEDFLGSSVSLSLGAQNPGAYYVSVTSSSLYSPGQYGLTVSAPPGSASAYEAEPNNSLKTANPVALDLTIKGQLAGSQDVDCYHVKATAAGTLVVDFVAPANAASAGATFTVSIYDAAGNLLQSEDTGNAPTLSAAVPASGDYYVKVTQGNGYDGGNYSLTVHNDGYSTMAAKALVGVSLVPLQLNAGHDWYSVNLVAGTTYEFGLAGLSSGGGTLADPSLSLCYSNGASLETCDNLPVWSNGKQATVADPQLAFTAPKTGTYYLMVGGNGGTGTFTLHESTDTVFHAATGLVQDLLYHDSNGVANDSWNIASQLGKPVALTYSFLNATADGETGFSPLTQAEQNAVTKVLAEYAAVANVTFTYVADPSTADIRFGTSNQSGSSGITHTSYLNGALSQADVFLDNSSGTLSFADGSYSLETLIHETGHALGLKHPGNYDALNGTGVGPYLPAPLDNREYTDMSYVNNPDSAVYDSTPGLLDIAAVQYLYGVNVSGTQAQTYSFSNSGAFVESLLGSGTRDTIDASGLSVASTIFLTPGTLSSVGVDANGNPAHDNLEIPFNQTVIKAIGGSGNDLIVGNDLNCTLTGGAGNDTLVGGVGTDTAVYSGIRANYTVTQTTSGYTVTDNVGTDGTDTLSGIEYLQFAGQQPIKLTGTAATDPASYQTAVEQLYVAYFGRPADYYGLLNMEASLAATGVAATASGLDAAYNTNATVKSLVDSFGTSSESTALYGTGSTASFVNAIFTHVLNRDALVAGLDYWTNAIDSGAVSKGDAALAIMDGALHNTSAQGLSDAQAVTNKATVASDFTHAIDTVLEIKGYSGAAAAASARSMLQTVSDTTDTHAFQATETSTLLAVSLVGVSSGTIS